MENNIFRAGVRPGGPTSHDEIKMLICYILSKLGQPMNFAQLHEALLENSLVNYFELVQVMDGLVRTGHLALETVDDVDTYSIAELGRQAGEEFANSLPLAVREKAVNAADRLLRQQQRAAEVSVEILPVEGGFQIQLAIPESGGNLISFTLFAPTREECGLLRRRFLNDPMFIYQGVLALLTGDRKTIGEIFPQKEQLF